MGGDWVNGGDLGFCRCLVSIKDGSFQQLSKK